MKRLFTAPFLVFIIAGTIIPMGVIAYYGFTNQSGEFTISNFIAMFEREHIKALLMSMLLAFIATLVCLIIAFPLAMIIKKTKLGEKGFMVFLFILPMWMNFVLRTMAWQVLLEKNGVINQILAALKINAEINVMNTGFAVVLGMVYDYLPFMILPIYNALMKIDDSLLEAAYDLGASGKQVFINVTIPLSVPGIVSGVTMVFVPALTTFAISNMLGGGKINLIGNIIEQEFTTSSNWNLGSGLSLFMMLFIVISMALINRFDRTGEGNVL